MTIAPHASDVLFANYASMSYRKFSMSLRAFFVQQLAQEIPYYEARHSIKPGITGWAQVRYPYGASVEDAKEKLQYDLYYVKNHSLFLDIMILIDTVQVVLWGKGAR
jgi:lipopolysaccharide/colanic/teichoic acid biosynthesis glycosyltransferase